VAAGVRSAALCAGVGVALPIRPVKGYSVTLAMDPSRPMPRVPVLDDTLHVTATPLGSRMRVAGTAEFTGYDTSLRAERIANLMDVLAAVYPSLARQLAGADTSPWAGLRPMTSDGLPYIGGTPLAGLYVDSGHGHLGWTLATGSARMLADLMEDRRPAVDPAPFRVGR
jgi:D-amino-acid dehydrogenase